MDSPISFVRVLGIDYGSKRVGLALSDPLGIIAQPFRTLPHDLRLVSAIKQVVEEERVTTIVIGMPLNLKGQETQSAEAARSFSEELIALLPNVQITFWDERFTSTIANRAIRDMGMGKKKREADKGKVDAIAAAVMLQNFLDSTKHSRSC